MKGHYYVCWWKFSSQDSKIVSRAVLGLHHLIKNLNIIAFKFSCFEISQILIPQSPWRPEETQRRRILGKIWLPYLKCCGPHSPTMNETIHSILSIWMQSRKHKFSYKKTRSIKYSFSNPIPSIFLTIRLLYYYTIETHPHHCIRISFLFIRHLIFIRNDPAFILFTTRKHGKLQKEGCWWMYVKKRKQILYYMIRT